MQTLRVSFNDINKHDDMCIIVDEFPTTIIHSATKPTEEGYAFINIYDGGLASYGYVVLKDAYHDNEPYTWSSSPSYINNLFKLTGTKYELQTWEIGVKDYSRGLNGCYCVFGITIELAKKLVLANQDKLHYSVEQYFRENFKDELIEIKPHKGLKITKERVYIKDKILIKTADGNYCDIGKLAEYILHKTGMWCSREIPEILP